MHWVFKILIGIVVVVIVLYLISFLLIGAAFGTIAVGIKTAVEDANDPKNLVITPKDPNLPMPRYIGCYKDKSYNNPDPNLSGNRDLTNMTYYPGQVGMTIDECNKLAKQDGGNVFGLQFQQGDVNPTCFSNYTGKSDYGIYGQGDKCAVDRNGSMVGSDFHNAIYEVA